MDAHSGTLYDWADLIAGFDTMDRDCGASREVAVIWLFIIDVAVLGMIPMERTVLDRPSYSRMK